MNRYRQLVTLIDQHKPQTIIEIGTHNGARAVMMCAAALKHNAKVNYTGFDLFGAATAETNEREHNGKGAGSRALAEAGLLELGRAHPQFTFQLIEGDTRETLHGHRAVADFVFIDGGHSVDTIRGDYEAVRDSSVVVFDDYYVCGVDTDKFGCNRVVEKIPHVVLPVTDHFGGTGFRMAVVQNSSKPTRSQRRQMAAMMKGMVEEAFAHSNKYGRGDPFNELKTYKIYEGENDGEQVDAVMVPKILEHMLDVDKALTDIKAMAQKVVAFTIETDAMRGMDYWKQQIARYFWVCDTVPLQDGYIGIVAACASPFGQDANVVTGGTPELRWANTVANCKVTDKRVAKVPPHDRVAILACYGPSLASNLQYLTDESKNPLADVISVSGSHDYLIDHGIKPDFHVECDARPHKADNIARGVEGVRYLIGSQVHPDFMAKLAGCDITLWHGSGEFNFKIIDELEPDALMIGGGSNVGLRAMVLFYQLGYRRFSIYGMDCSFSDDGEQKWAGAHAMKKNPVEQQIVQVRCNGYIFTSSPIYLLYANQFFDTVKQLRDAQFNVFGFSLLQAMARDYMRLAAEAA